MMPPRSRRRIWPHDFLHRFEVGLDDGVLEARRAAADIFAGVDVDGDERFGVVDDDVAAGLEPHFRAQRLVEFLLNAEFLEDGRFLRVQLHARNHLRLEAAHEFDDLGEFLFVVEPDGDVVVAQVVAQDALHQVQVAVEQGRRAALLGGGANGVPGAAEKFDVGANFVVACAAGRRANDKSAGKCSLRFGHHAAQARAVFGGADAPRHADVIHRRHVDQIAAGQRDVAGDARAFFAQRFLGDLNDDFLARLQHFGNQLGTLVLLRAAGGRAACAGADDCRLDVRHGDRRRLRWTASAAHGPLESGARLIGNARAGGLLLTRTGCRVSPTSCGVFPGSCSPASLLHAALLLGAILSVIVFVIVSVMAPEFARVFIRLFRRSSAAIASSCISSASASASAAASS